MTNRERCYGERQGQPRCQSCLERLCGYDDLATCEYLENDAPVVPIDIAMEQAQAELDRDAIAQFLRREDRKRGAA